MAEQIRFYFDQGLTPANIALRLSLTDLLQISIRHLRRRQQVYRHPHSSDMWSIPFPANLRDGMSAWLTDAIKCFAAEQRSYEWPTILFSFFLSCKKKLLLLC